MLITPSRSCDVYGICKITRSIGHTLVLSSAVYRTAKTGRLSESITLDKLRRTKIPFVVLLKYFIVINKLMMEKKKQFPTYKYLIYNNCTPFAYFIRQDRIKL